MQTILACFFKSLNSNHDLFFTGQSLSASFQCKYSAVSGELSRFTTLEKLYEWSWLCDAHIKMFQFKIMHYCKSGLKS